MRTYTNDELKEILASHAKWLKGDGGQRANLRDGDLSYANLRYANLRDANLSYTDLSYAILNDAILNDAILTGAILNDAILTGADLIGAEGNGREVMSSYVHPWRVVHTDNIVAIGCQQHSKSDWLNFTDDEISEMSPRALVWWKEWKPKLIDMGIF